MLALCHPLLEIFIKQLKHSYFYEQHKNYYHKQGVSQMENRKIVEQDTQNDQLPLVLSTKSLQNTYDKNDSGPNYKRLVYQPILNGLALGPSLFFLNNFQTKLQNRPANMSLIEFCRKQVAFDNFSKKFSKNAFANFVKNFDKANANKTIFQAFSSMVYATSGNLLKSCHHTMHGVFHNTQNSILKSVFSANAPTVERHIHEHVNVSHRERAKDAKEEAGVSQSIKPINDFYVAAFLTGGMSGIETVGTTYFANRAKCNMLKKEVVLTTFMDKVKFARLGMSARFGKNYYSQFVFLCTDKLAQPFYVIFPKDQYGFLALGLASTVTGCANAVAETAFDVVNNKRWEGLQTTTMGEGDQSKFNYALENMRCVAQDLHKCGGARIFTRGLVLTSIASCTVIGVTKWIGQKLDELENTPSEPIPKCAGTGFSLFDSWSRKPLPAGSAEKYVEILDEPEEKAGISLKQ